MSYYLFLIELFAIVLYVIPKLAWNFFKYRTINGALKVRIALLLMALFKIGHLLVIVTHRIEVPVVGWGWWSFGSTAAFISLFIYSERPHETKRRSPTLPGTKGDTGE